MAVRNLIGARGRQRVCQHVRVPTRTEADTGMILWISRGRTEKWCHSCRDGYDDAYKHSLGRREEFDAPENGGTRVLSERTRISMLSTNRHTVYTHNNEPYFLQP